MRDTISHKYQFTKTWYINDKNSIPVAGSKDTDIEGWPILDIAVTADITLIPKFDAVL